MKLETFSEIIGKRKTNKRFRFCFSYCHKQNLHNKLICQELARATDRGPRIIFAACVKKRCAKTGSPPRKLCAIRTAAGRPSVTGDHASRRDGRPPRATPRARPHRTSCTTHTPGEISCDAHGPPASHELPLGVDSQVLRHMLPRLRHKETTIYPRKYRKLISNASACDV